MTAEVKKVLEDLVELEKNPHNHYDEYEVDDIIAKAQKLLDEEEIEKIFDNFRYFVTGTEKQLEEITELVKSRDKITFVKKYGIYERPAELINKYWNNFDKLFDYLETILIIVDNADVKIEYQTLKEITTDSAIAQINLKREKENK